MFQRTGYQTHPQEICPEKPSLGRANILPWDTETFGFPVASYDPPDELSIDDQKLFSRGFQAWTERNRVQICSCSLDPGNAFWKVFLPTAGFRFVDLSVRASYNNLHKAPLPRARAQLRSAVPSDWSAIEDLASRSFHHGRYHADPLVPREFADRRYRDWIRRALLSNSGIDRVYVLEHRGEVRGFYHCTVEKNESDLRLAAVSSQLQGTGAGFELYLSVLHGLKSVGVQRVNTSISAANIPILNVFSALGFRFSDPKAIYHWHAGHAFVSG